MPRLRSDSLPYNATPDEIAKAQALRKKGKSYQAIAESMGRSIEWAKARTRHIVTPPKPKKAKGLALPADPVLRRRIMNLAKRGFDVPPSKQADWDVLAKAGYPVDERRRILGLE